MVKKLLLCLSLLCLKIAFGQKEGYYGKKNVIDFTVNFQNPTFANSQEFFNDFLPDFLEVKGNFLDPTVDRFDWGLRFNYARLLKRSLAIGIEIGRDYFSVQRQSRQDKNEYKFYYFETIDVNSLSIMPKIEFTQSGGLLPMGISHQIGLGIRMIKPIEKEYNIVAAETNFIDSYDLIDPNLAQYAMYVGKPIRGYTLMYSLSIRSPITKFLLLNYGLRYTLNFMDKPNYEIEEIDQISDLNLIENEFKDMVRSRKQFSFVQGFIGLSFAF